MDLKVEETMNQVDKDIADILKGEARPAEVRPTRPLVTPLTRTAETVPAEVATPAALTITERLAALADQMNMLHGYVREQANTLESKLDKIIAILK